MIESNDDVSIHEDMELGKKQPVAEWLRLKDESRRSRDPKLFCAKRSVSKTSPCKHCGSSVALKFKSHAAYCSLLLAVPKECQCPEKKVCKKCGKDWG